MTSAAELARALRAGDRRALSKAITLVESTRPVDREAARELLALLGPASAATWRIGVTGVPGAGKSTLIDALGEQAIRAGRRVAVLAVDPSSRQSGGSVLGDKTRMSRLAADASAYVRPSPTLGVLGGIAARTRESISLCEAAGYDLVFVETVGVGQSEEQVASLVDCVLLLLLSGAGDEISSMKRGILEAADVIAFNKADGERAASAASDASALRSSLAVSRGQQTPPVLVVSALQGTGITELWQALGEHHARAESLGEFRARRTRQRTEYFSAAFDEALSEALARRPGAALARRAAEASVQDGTASPWEAAQRLVLALLPEPESSDRE
ncbi:MAG TPA: methylmalonyl Co-A mutase-associated GTPase MeaB [Polyangiaceae bacterium]|nr:methylmalonyl Co-A mutase-associated GTPase MeaB [Polyangiaceae bacterium]